MQHGDRFANAIGGHDIQFAIAIDIHQFQIDGRGTDEMITLPGESIVAASEQDLDAIEAGGDADEVEFTIAVDVATLYLG